MNTKSPSKKTELSKSKDIKAETDEHTSKASDIVDSQQDLKIINSRNTIQIVYNPKKQKKSKPS